MSSAFSPVAPLDQEFLPIRAKILEIAAALDRIQRNDVAQEVDSRWNQLQAGIALLQAGESERAEQVQLLFSRTYDEQWRQTLDVPTQLDS